MKKCSRCKQELPFEYFSKGKSRHGKDVYQSFCKKCIKDYQKNYYNQNKDSLINQTGVNSKNKRNENTLLIFKYLKTHPCVDCGENNPIVLEFDHIKDKKYQISRMLGSYSWDKILSEIEKCEVRCANCHRIKTSKQFNWKILKFIENN